MRKAIKAGRLIDGKGSQPFDNPVILIDGERISMVGKAEDIPQAKEMEVIDLGRMTLLPGLADCHVHYCLNGETSYDIPMLKELIPFQAIRAAEYARRDLMAGFTTIRAVADKGFIDVGLKQAINAGFAVGPRLAVSGHMLSITGGRDNFAPEVCYSDNIWTNCDGPDGVTRAAREQLKYDVDWIKLGVTGAVTVGGGMPGAQQLTEEEIRAAVTCARMYGKKVSAHAHGASGIKAAIREGVDSIEHGLLIDQEAAEMMVANGTYWLPTFAPIHYILNCGVEKGIPQSMVDRSQPISDNQKRWFKKALEMGVKIVMGTDVGMPFNYHGQNAYELQLMVEAGMTPMQAIVSATSRAAEMLGWSDKTGAIAPGLFADIVAVDGDPLVDIKVLQDVKFVMKGGEIVKHTIL